MRITTTIIASILFLAGALAIQDPSFAQDSCEGGPDSYKLMIHVNENRPTRVTHKGDDATDFEVCIGDSVEWQLVGSAKQFYLDFVAGAPFAGASNQHSANGKVQVSIGGSATPGERYKYDVGIVDGGVLDPVIIIRV